MALLKFKRSATPAKVPTIADLDLGELALNTFDGKVYMKKDDGTQAVVEVGGGGGGSGTVTSVAATVPTGFSISGSPITTSGTLAISFSAGYALPTTAKQTEWDSAYTDRLKWDGGATGLVAATGRTSLGATTIGANVFTLTNPSAITFPRFNADNTVSALSASDFRTAIGAGTSSTTGTVTSVAATAGTGISISGSPITTSGTLTITNTAPDQTVVLTQGGTTTITGTYPNFTISSADQFSGTVTSVGGTGTVNGITLTGTVTTSGNLTLGGTLSGVSLTTQVTGTLPVANGGTGATTLTGVVIGNGTSAFTTVTAPSGTIVGTTDTQTLTNKAITPRVNAQTTTTSPWAWNSDSYDQQSFSALANALTINADAGTPVDGEKHILRFKDNATPRVLTFTGGASKAFRDMTGLLTVSGSNFTYTTTASKTVYFGCVYNGADARWDIIALTAQP